MNDFDFNLTRKCDSFQCENCRNEIMSGHGRYIADSTKPYGWRTVFFCKECHVPEKNAPIFGKSL